MQKPRPGPYIEHLTAVGDEKAVGLLSFREIRDLGYAPGKLAQLFNQKAGFLVIEVREGDLFWGEKTPKERETLAVACLPMLQKLIDGQKDSVEKSGWPTLAEDFFRKSLASFVLGGKDTPEINTVQDIIVTAYAHPYYPKAVRHFFQR